MTFNGRFVLTMIEFAAMQGANRSELLELTQQKAEVLIQEECKVEEGIYNKVAERIEEMTGDSFFGLHLGEQLNLSAAGLISQISQTSATVKEALELCCEFASLGCRALPMTLSEEKDNYKLSFRPDPIWFQNSPVSVRHTLDGYVAFSLRQFHTLTRQKYFPLAIHYVGPRVKGAEEYFRVFNCEVLFQQKEYALIFEKAQIHLPIVTSDYSLLRVLVAHANEKMNTIQAEAGFYATVKKSIVNLIKPGFPSIQQVAANLNISVRTLQRKLQSEGHTYKKLMEDLRKDFAMSYLKDPNLNISEVAYLLSYSDATAFIRSFRRWTGHSPKQYRQLKLGSV